MKKCNFILMVPYDICRDRIRKGFLILAGIAVAQFLGTPPPFLHRCFSVPLLALFVSFSWGLRFPLPLRARKKRVAQYWWKIVSPVFFLPRKIYVYEIALDFLEEFGMRAVFCHLYSRRYSCLYCFALLFTELYSWLLYGELFGTYIKKLRTEKPN